jgi:hypothetical protein
MSPSTCPNCEKEAIGTYCHHCGQKQGVQRLTWRYLLEDLQQRLFGFDNNYLRTIRDLTIRPGNVVHTIIDGVRVKYVGPIGYYFVMLTIYVLLMSFLEIDFGEMSKGLVAEANTEFEQKFQDSLFSSIFSNFRVTSFVMAPFFIFGVWLVFRKKKYNFLETSVLYFYGQGHTMILSMIVLVIYYFSEDLNLTTYLLPVSLLYFAFVCASFYSGNAIWNFIKAILGFLLGYIILMFVFAIGMIIYILLNPEILEQMGKPASG